MCVVRVNYDSDHLGNINQLKLKTMKSLRERVDWKIKSNRLEFLGRIEQIVKHWTKQLPNLWDIFRPEEIDLLLTDSIIHVCENYHEQIGGIFIEFVARTGYKDKPEVVNNEQLVLHRTTAVHQVSKYAYPRHNPELIINLFRVYDKADVTYIDESGQTHFHVACMYGLEDIVEEFLESGQDPNYLWASTGDSPLHLALKNQHPFVAQLLLLHGADPNLACNGFTPLHWIMLLRTPFKVSLMVETFFDICDDLKKSVQIDAQDESGQTPLFLALHHECSSRVFELLLRRGANPHLISENGFSPLDIICKKWSEDDIVKILQMIDEKHQLVRIDDRDEFGNTSLHIALTKGLTKLAEFLLRKGANANSPNAEGCTALHNICCRKDERYSGENHDFVKMLFKTRGEKQQQVNIDALDKTGYTPLHVAQSHDRRDTVQFLLTNGAYPTFTNDHRWTPLQIICEKEDNDLKLYFKIDDDKYQAVQVDATKDRSNRTPLQWAVTRFMPEVVEILLDRGADLSSFVFPAESDFTKIFDPEIEYYNCFKLRLATDAMIVIEQLEKKGYKLDPKDALTIMKFFAKLKLFPKSVDLENNWYDNNCFAIRAKNMMIKPSLSLYDLIKLQPNEASKLLTYKDYKDLIRSDTLAEFPEWYEETCALHLCEKLLRRFFRDWTIMDHLNNEDLYNICLTATGQSF